jgi:hypothetical protein
MVLPDRIELSTSPLPRERASIQTGRVGGQSCIGYPPKAGALFLRSSRTRTGLRLCERNKFVWIDSGSGITINRRAFGGQNIDYRPLATDMPSDGHEVTSQPTRRDGGANVSLMDSRRQVAQLAANCKARWLRAEGLLVRNCPSAWIATGGRRLNARRG